MPSMGEIWGDLGLDTSKFVGGTKKAKTALGGFEKGAKVSSNNIAAGFLKAQAVWAGFTQVLKAGATEIGAMIDASSRSVEVQNLFEVSFGDMAGAAEDWATRTQTAIGVNDTTMKEMAGTMFNMTSAMGMTEEAAFAMGTGFTELALDTASFFNLPFDAAFKKIQSGISGEVEPLKQLGIVVTENAMNQLDWVAAIKEAGGQLTEQEKIVARSEIIISGLSNAQGDLMRTSQSWANQTRLIGEAWEDFRETMGAFVTESQTVGFVLGFVTDTIREMTGEVEENGAAFDNLVNTSLSATITVMGGVLKLTGLIISGFGEIGLASVGLSEKLGFLSGQSEIQRESDRALAEGLAGTGEAMLAGAVKAEMLVENLRLVAEGNTVTTAATLAAKEQMDDSESSVAKLRDLMGELAANATGAGDGLGEVLIPALDDIELGFQGVIREVEALTSEAFPAYAEGTKEIADIVKPQFQQLEEAARTLGLTTRSQMTAMYTEGKAAYDLLAAAGWESSEQRIEAEKALAEFTQTTAEETTAFQLTAQEALLSGTGQLLGQLGEKNKVAAIAGAIINTLQAIAKAHAAAPFPFNIPLMAATAALGYANVSKIRGADPGGYAEGTPGLDFQNFGRETTVPVHGREAIIPERGGAGSLAKQIAAALQGSGGDSGGSVPSPGAASMVMNVYMDAGGRKDADSLFDELIDKLRRNERQLGDEMALAVGARL